MRISCNGCRVLRKGCSEDCTLRPCLDWLTSPESQGNATLFLAKFYGRAGLITLISAAPTRLRPEIFKSLLFEACGRIINPVSGSVGLISSGDWPRCQSAVAAVLSGGRIIEKVPGDDVKRSAGEKRRRVETRNRRRRSDSAEFCVESEAKFTITGWGCGGEDGKDFVIDRELASHDSDSVETLELSLARFDERVAEPESRLSEVGLELTLGLNPLYHYVRAPIQISDNEES